MMIINSALSKIALGTQVTGTNGSAGLGFAQLSSVQQLFIQSQEFLACRRGIDACKLAKAFDFISHVFSPNTCSIV